MSLHRAYIAGVLDSDGHIRWHSGQREPRVGVTNMSLELMASLQESIGGNYSLRARRCPDACALPHVHARSDVYCYEVTGERAAIVLRAVRRYLVVKQDRADEVLERYGQALAEMQRPRRRLHHMRQARTAMLALGWPDYAVFGGV